ncbi:MAG: diguanylate cyclase [Gemmatimonadales bacterium]|nr:MAG: diguanylate cyclase [Gemmatimonadales bacterium]
MIGEPNDWTFRALQTIMAPEGFEVIQARTAAELLEQVRGIRPDLVMVSDSYSDLEPPEICRLLREMNSFNPATPILVTTSEVIDETRHLENLRAGAWDTVRLPANAEQLLLKIGRYVDAKAMSDFARHDGMLDGLTGFYNLKGLLRRTEEEAAEAWRFRRAMSCMVFGPVIPPESTDEGPEVDPEELRDRPELEKGLIEIFRRMGRRSDVIGRLNPTEFIVVAPSTDEGGAVLMGERLLAEMRHLTIPVDGREVKVEMRAGYYSPGDPTPTSVEPVDMVSRAAGALRRSQTQYDPAEEIAPWRDGDVMVLPGGGREAMSNGNEIPFSCV